ELGGPNQASIDLEAEVEREASQAHQRGQQEAAQADEAIETPTERAQRRRLERQHRPKGSSVREAPASLAQAARSGNLREVMRLLEAGAVAELPDSLGRQPIFEAAASGSTDVTAVLLLHGVALSDAKDSEGRRPCDLAAPGSPLQRMLELFAGRRPE
ncbi:unnamed protein product, partial [Polarella glacialis]